MKPTDRKTIAAMTDASDRERSELLYSIHELSRLITTHADLHMASVKMTDVHGWALMHIYEQEGLTQTELAELTNMGRAALGKLVERLETKSWIEQHPKGQPGLAHPLAALGASRVRAHDRRGQGPVQGLPSRHFTNRGEAPAGRHPQQREAPRPSIRAARPWRLGPTVSASNRAAGDARAPLVGDGLLHILPLTDSGLG